ncbi:MAG: ATP-binding cassette domain-containing protein [Reinekea sp.]
MTILQAHNLACYFANGDKLFENIHCNLTRRRTGLVGDNGVGKSILAATLAGEYTPSAGQVQRTSHIGCFWQLPSVLLSSDLTIAQYLQLDNILNALNAIEAGASESHWFDQIGDRWFIREELANLLSELSITGSPEQRCAELSGGQLGALQLWKLFQSNAELLILDEPSNHLDRDTRQWLIKQMRNFSGYILLISHDRQLLNEMTEIWALNPSGLECYGESFEDYLIRKEQHRQATQQQLKTIHQAQTRLQQQAQRNREKAQQRRSQGNKERNQGSQPKVLLDAKKDRATANTSQRLKNEDRQRRELNQKAQALQQHWQTIKPQKLYLDNASHNGARLVSVESCILPFGFARPISFVLSTGSKLHLRGKNGSGKSTLLKVLLGDLQPAAGTAKVNGPLYYLDQHFSLLDTNSTMLDNLIHHCAGLSEVNARTLLANIGFRRDSVFRTTQQLSGGEKMKLAMLIVSHQPDSPLLLLDEPDNHLDISSQQMLAEALRQYSGSFILISHDDAFVDDAGVTKVIELSSHS